jgi:hypothetical protein
MATISGPGSGSIAVLHLVRVLRRSPTARTSAAMMPEKACLMVWVIGDVSMCRALLS